MKPVRIKIEEKKDLLIKWDDGRESSIPLKKLRENCPCATCVTFRERESKSYIPILHESQTSVKNINIIGSYAVGIEWKDGHNTGIYEFSFLKKLAEEE